jgi:hypothetical protein
MGEGTTTSTYPSRVLDRTATAHTLEIAKKELTMADIAAKPVAAGDTRAVPAAKKLGLIAATALGIGNLIGLGVFLLPSSLAPYGLLSLVGWIITTVGAVLLANPEVQMPISATMRPDRTAATSAA